MAQKMRIFKKVAFTKANGKVQDRSYYWASVSDTDKNGEWISATVFVRMSKDAAKVFKAVCEETKNEDVMSAWVNVTDSWLKAVPGKDGNRVVLFINDIEPIEG